MPQGFSTRAVHAGAPSRRAGEPLVAPIVQSSTFFSDTGSDGEVLYTRYGNNPSQTAVAERLASLEGAEAAVVTSSGMGAIALALLAFLDAGDHVVASRDLYGGTHRLLTRDLSRLGITTTFVGPGGRFSPALRKRTRVVLIEMPSNPALRVPDLDAVTRLAREKGVAVVVDATFATPVNFRPLEHCADVVVHSATKYLSGHSDLTVGVVAGGRSVVEEVREKMKSFGQAVDPHAAWLLERGVKTLGLRVERQNRTALALARWLESHPAVETVLHPGLPSHPDHEIASRVLNGYGGMLSLVVRGGDAAAQRVLERMRLFAVAPSLGGVESLASMPRHTSHKHMTDEERAELGIAPGFVRLSIGIEDEPDLRADLDQALNGGASA